MHDIKLFIITHKDAAIPKHPYFFPIQVGCANSDLRLPDMLYDNEGIHISDKNRSYCELTAHYWAWKNSSADYYGFFHYRRYLNFSKIYPVKNRKNKLFSPCPYQEQETLPTDLNAFGMSKSAIYDTISDFDIITGLSEHMDVTVYEQFCQFHNQSDLDTMLDILKKRHPEMTDICDTYMNSKYIYFCNLYVMKKELFFAYMEWLFPLLEEFEAQKDFSTCDASEMRITGYLAERLFGIYYTQLKQQSHIRCGEAKIAIFRQNIRDFYIGKHRYKITINMNRLNRLMPAGSLRRRCVRRFFRKDLR